MRRILIVMSLLATVVAPLPSTAAESAKNAKNIERLAQMPVSQFPRAGLAFQDDLVVMGQRYGFTLARILPRAPYLEHISSFTCPASEWADVSIWGDYVFMSIEDQFPWGPVKATDADLETPDCNNTDSSNEQGGIRIVDISNPRWPRQVKFAQIPGGSETHALVPDGNQLYIYSMTPLGDVDRNDPKFKLRVLKFDPQRPRDIREVGDADTRPSYGCFDITVLLIRRPLAACTMWGSTWLFDISDPPNPRLLEKIVEPTAHWTSGVQFTWDGRYLVVADAAEYFFHNSRSSVCDGNEQDHVGVLWFYDITDPRNPRKAGRFALPRSTPDGKGICSAMSVAVLPMKDPRRYIATVAWFKGGFDVVDFSDPTDAREIAYWSAGDDPLSAVWYNGRIYSGAGAEVSPWRLEAFRAKGLGPSQVRYFSRRYNPSTQMASFGSARGWLSAARRRTAPPLRASGPPAGGGSQEVEGSLMLRSGFHPTEDRGHEWCFSNLHRALRWEHANRSAQNGTFFYFFDVDRATWGERFLLKPTEGHRDIDLDIYFLFKWGSDPISRSPLEVVETVAPGGERGVVPHYVRHAFVCTARGERISVEGAEVNSPTQQISFVYRAGRPAR